MARDELTPGFDAATRSRTALTHDVIDITLPSVILTDGTVLSAVVLNLATAKVTRPLSLGSTVYQPAIRAMGGITYSLGTAPDDATWELENLRGIYGELMLDPERTLDGAYLVCHRAANVAGRGQVPVWEFDELFAGTIHGVGASGEAVRFGVVDEMSDPANLIGGRELTQRCGDVFEGPFCGHTGAPPGATCTHLFDDGVGGCLFWQNQPRFYGIPPLRARTAQAMGLPAGGIVPGYVPGGGFPDDSAPRRIPFYDRDYRRPWIVMEGVT
jgi:hypothetical protein